MSPQASQDTPGITHLLQFLGGGLGNILPGIGCLEHLETEPASTCAVAVHVREYRAVRGPEKSLEIQHDVLLAHLNIARPTFDGKDSSTSVKNTFNHVSKRVIDRLLGSRHTQTRKRSGLKFQSEKCAEMFPLDV